MGWGKWVDFYLDVLFLYLGILNQRNGGDFPGGLAAVLSPDVKPSSPEPNDLHGQSMG